MSEQVSLLNVWFFLCVREREFELELQNFILQGL